METKSAKGSSVLLFGLSFNLILTLTLFGFTCFSMNRFDSRLTAVEHDLLATNSPYRHTDGAMVKPKSSHSPLNGPQKKTNVAKRAVDNSPWCRKCRSACLNLNAHRAVSCSSLIVIYFNLLFILSDCLCVRNTGRIFDGFVCCLNMLLSLIILSLRRLFFPKWNLSAGKVILLIMYRLDQ